MAYKSTSSSAVLFSGVSGTAVSDIASLGRILIQLMTRAGYPADYSAALTSATSMLAPIIPPERRDDHLCAGGRQYLGRRHVHGGRRSRACFSAVGFHRHGLVHDAQGQLRRTLPRPGCEFLRQTLRVLPFLGLPVIIVGGIFSGVFTVTESAAIGRPTRSVRLAEDAAAAFAGRVRRDALQLRDRARSRACCSTRRDRRLDHDLQRSRRPANGPACRSRPPNRLPASRGGHGAVLGTVMEPVPIMIALAPLLAPIARSTASPTSISRWFSSSPA